MNPTSVLVARRNNLAFTLVELLVSIAVLTVLVVLVSQMVSHVAVLAAPANKRIDSDTEARMILDRLAVDFGQMLKRTDIDYYFKAGTTKHRGKSGNHGKGGGGGGQTELNDSIAFYSQIPGYSSVAGSPISLVAYRVN